MSIVALIAMPALLLVGIGGYELGNHGPKTLAASAAASRASSPQTSTTLTNATPLTVATTSTTSATPQITTSTSQVLAATQIETCEASHGMTNQFMDYTNAEQDTQTFEECQWPPTNATQSDGFWSVQVYSQPGPYNYEASDADVTNILNPTCSTVSITLQMGSQGTRSTLPPVTLTEGEITSVDHLGQPWNGPTPYPYVPSQDIAILSNSNYGITVVRCIP